MENHKRGFTLIELIVVIAIIAILAAIVVMGIRGYIQKAQNVRMISDVASYAKALDLAYVENGEYPEDPVAPDYVCLGHYETGYCWDGFSVAESATVNDALSPFIPALPGNDNKVCTEGNHGCFNGYMYLKESDQIAILYILAGANQSCGPGIVNVANWNGTTYCEYIKSLASIGTVASGESCTSDEECVSGSCVDSYNGNFCTDGLSSSPCESHSDCTQNGEICTYACYDYGSGGKCCSGALPDNSGPCDSSDQCQSNFCNGHSWCSSGDIGANCSSDSDCPVTGYCDTDTFQCAPAL